MLSFSAGLTVQKAPFSGILSRRFLRPAPLHFFDASLFGSESRLRRSFAGMSHHFSVEGLVQASATSAGAKRRDQDRAGPNRSLVRQWRRLDGLPGLGRHASVLHCCRLRWSSSISALATRRRAVPHLPDCLLQRFERALGPSTMWRMYCHAFALE